MSMIEDSDNKAGETEARVGELNRTQEDQNQGRAVATAFHDDTTEREFEYLLSETIVEIGTSTEKVGIKCPSKPITHAF